jgi:hypothetical protein
VLLLHVLLLQSDAAPDESPCAAAVLLLTVCCGRLILCLTMSGRTARLICKYRPVAPILCATADEQTGGEGFAPALLGSSSAPRLVTRSSGPRRVKHGLVSCVGSSLLAMAQHGASSTGAKDGLVCRCQAGALHACEPWLRALHVPACLMSVRDHIGAILSAHSGP